MRLIDQSLHTFCTQLAGASPTPGGGSAAALAGALAASLCAMTARLTAGKKAYQNVWSEMESLCAEADALAEKLLALVERDTEAYNRVVSARRLPRETGAQKAERQAAIEEAGKEAARVPLETLRSVEKLLDPAQMAVDQGNPNCITDAGVAVGLIRTAAEGAAYNVRVNLGGLRDEAFCRKIGEETETLIGRIRVNTARLAARVNAALG